MPELVSVVIPCYNEVENVPVLAEKVRAVFDPLEDYDYECLFVNDGSTDGTREALDELAGRNPCVRPLHLAENCGQSGAMIAGMRRSKGDYVMILDGDLQNDPCDIPEMLRLLKDYDCVCGYRANRNDNWIRKVSSRVANKVRNWILHDGIRDSGCGSKGFRRECVDYLVSFNGVHRFLAVLVRNAGFSIVECPVAHHARVHGVSKYGIHNRLWRGIYDLIGVAWLRKRYVHPKVEGEE